MQQVDRSAKQAPSPSPRARGLSGWLPDALGLLWVWAAGLAVLAPALVHGLHLGPFDLLSQYGLSARSGVVVHNTSVGDQIDQMVPWTTLAWNQVHHGQLPLWNPYNGLGMPLAFNWQSASFGLPALVGYLAPVQYAYTVGVIVTLLVAGSGAYVLARILHLGVLGSAMAGTVFELSGPFIGWLGWPHAAVISWIGWLFAAGILVSRGEHRVRNIVFVAAVLAAAIYAGQPEVLVLLLFAFGVFMLVLLVQMALAEGIRVPLRVCGDLVLAGVAGAALAAPLALPGLQLVGESIRSTAAGGAALPARDITHLLFQGFDGLPIPGGGHNPFYSETAGYLGITAIVLAGVALTTRWRRPEVRAFAVVAIVTGAIVFVPFVASFMGGLPGVGSVAWHRSLLTLAFAVALLAGTGLDALILEQRERIWWWVGSVFAAFGLVLVLLYAATVVHLPPVPREIRARSFIWPSVEVAVGLVVVLGFIASNRRRHAQRGFVVRLAPEARYAGRSTLDVDDNNEYLPDGVINRPPRPFTHLKRVRLGSWAGLMLLACETLFLIVAGAPLWSSSATFFAPTSAEVGLQQAVGSSTVGIGAGKILGGFGCVEMGMIPDTNDAYQVHELGLYDPTTPKAFYQTWTALTRQPSGVPSFNEFCPFVTTVSVARRYGVEFVLEPKGTAGPKGSVFVKKLGDEALYRIPGAAAATLTSMGNDGRMPSAEEAGTPVAVFYPSPTSWRLTTDAATPQVLRLRLNNVPGWHASIDGKPLRLEAFSGVMLQARIPSGRHVIELHYWPNTFSLGLVLGGLAFVSLLVAIVVSFIRPRRTVSVEFEPSDPGAKS